MSNSEQTGPVPDVETLEKLKKHLSALNPETLESIGRFSEAMKNSGDAEKLQYLKDNQEQILKDRDHLIQTFSAAGLISPEEAEKAKKSSLPET